MRGRPLTSGERALAAGVFGDALDLAPVRLHAHPFGAFAVTIGPRILFPGEPPRDFAAAPLEAQGWLVHELVHAWQFQTAPLRTLASWAKVALSGGYGPGLPGYRYPWPPPPWRRLNLEQQASLVQDAFLDRGRRPRFGVPETAKGVNPARYAGLTPFKFLDGRPRAAGVP